MITKPLQDEKYVIIEHHPDQGRGVCHLLLQTVAAGRPEPLSSKLLEKCLSQLVTKPVVPGHGEMPLFLPLWLETCPGLTEAAAVRK